MFAFVCGANYPSEPWRDLMHVRRSWMVFALAACSDGQGDRPEPVDTDRADEVDSDDEGTDDDDSDAVGDAGPLYVSGTRLTVTAWELEDGRGVPRFVIDTASQEPCAFLHDREGSLRCLPAPDGYIERYLDDSCTQPIWFTTSACDAVTATSRAIVEDVCEEDRRYDVIPLTLASTPAAVWALNGSDCEPGEDTAALYVSAWFVPGASADPSGYVAATETVESRGDGLGVRVWTADDGTRLVHAMADEQLDASCTALRLDEAAASSCVSTRVAWYNQPSSHFADAGCSEAALVSRASPAACPPDVLLSWDDAGTTWAYAVGAGHTGDVYRFRPPSTCTLHAPPSTLSWWAPGRRLSSADFPGLGEGRLGAAPAPRVHTTSSGVALMAFAGDDGLRFVDAAGAPCIPARIDGPDAGVCVPGDTRRVPAAPSLFSDALCTQPVMGLDVASDASPPARVWAEWPRNECGPAGGFESGVVGMWDLGAEYSGVLYADDGGCVALDDPGSVDHRWFAATPVDLGTLVPLTVVR